MRTPSSLYLLAAMTCSMVIGCKNYSYSVNDKVLYTPKALYTDYAIADDHLRGCVQQTISDNHISKAEDLKQLNCSNAGITTLAGLEKFSSLEQLNLAENKLSAAPQVSQLAHLKVLSLRKNNLTNAEPLLHLLHLRELDISENANLPCGDLKQLLANFQKGELKILLPEQCKAVI